MRIAASVLLSLVMSQAASAGKAENAVILQAITGSDVAILLDEVGHAPRIDRDAAGDPVVRGQVAGVGYVVLFYDCDDQGRCGALQFRAWFTETGSAGIEFANAWNRRSRMGRVYVDVDGDLTLEKNIRVHGGVTPEYLRRERDWFAGAVLAFGEALRAVR